MATAAATSPDRLAAELARGALDVVDVDRELRAVADVEEARQRGRDDDGIAHGHVGLADIATAALATAKLGDPRQIARAFRPELAARHAAASPSPC